MNYPADISQYRNNPKSPEYDHSGDDAYSDRTNEIAREMITPDGYTYNGVLYNMDDVLERIASKLAWQHKFQELLAEVMAGNKTVDDMRDFVLEHALVEASDLAELEG